MSKLVLSIDQGTTGTTVMLVDEGIRIVGKVTHEFAQVYPQPGWVEHDPEAIWTSVENAIAELLAKTSRRATEIACIGITNQRETTILWDLKQGTPVHNAIVWQDRRTAAACEALRADGLNDTVRERTGLVLDPYFSGTKLRWLLDHVPSARNRAEHGELGFGTVDSFLIFRLSGRQAHVTDVSNASRTMLFSLRDLAWDPELLRMLDIPARVLPQVKSSSEVYGHTLGVRGLPDGIPICGAAGDQQSALFGQACFQPGDAKCTYGTGAFLLVNTGRAPVRSESGLLSTVAWQIAGETTYALEGSAFIAGAAVQWLRDGLGLFANAADVEALAAQVPDSGGVVFVPALVGLGAPHWRADARGVVAGITRGTTKAHLARATLEGIAFQVQDLAAAMSRDAAQRLRAFKVDGGASANNLLMQFQANIMDVDIVRPRVIETTALGAAFLAGLAAGIWHSTDEIARTWACDRVFEPAMSAAERTRLLTAWQKAVAIA